MNTRFDKLPLVHTAKAVKVLCFVYWLSGMLMGMAIAALILVGIEPNLLTMRL